MPLSEAAFLLLQGSSLGQYFEQYLRPIRLNTEPVKWSQKDLTFLERVRLSSKRKGFIPPCQMTGNAVRKYNPGSFSYSATPVHVLHPR